MAFSPFEAFEHLKETVCSYLETAYRISDRAVFSERGALLRQEAFAGRSPAVAQDPFIESTPAFPGSQYLATLVSTISALPVELVELAAYGMPVREFPLYDHQEQALRQSHGKTPNLVVATGTASGKTEIFLLLILADILREALTWPAPIRAPQVSTYNTAQQAWLHSRLHERRPAATRAIILYPMNALVNDQLQRLRRILADPRSESWQRSVLHDNVIYFGMYTGETQPTGHWSNTYARDRWNQHLSNISATWNQLSDDLKKRGSWPRPDSPEMLCRWDMQKAPPDILVTNYSMLEYMLARPIEGPVFDSTAHWLRTCENSRVTLVLDEAHTYTGARGTEIAHLVRRLKERLGIRAGDGRLRCVATSASLPSGPAAHEDVCKFASALFDEDVTTFSSIIASPSSPPPTYSPSQAELRAFSSFGNTFDPSNPMPAIGTLVNDLALGAVNMTEKPPLILHKALRQHPVVVRTRALTTRNATQLEALSTELWGTLGSSEDRRRATAGALAAGAFAREKDLRDAPPLISSRVHMFFRGLPGLWACMDPNCSKTPSAFGAPTFVSRAVGRLYTEPTPWCECGARVLEVFTCRVCGLMFLGGIPDAATHSLWPWTDDLESGRPDLNDFEIFGVEPAYPGAATQTRSIYSTQPVAPGERGARFVYEVRGTTVAGVPIPFPYECPRCHNRRQPGPDGREIIEPLRTKGSKAFSVLVEDGFRLQSPTYASKTANKGRKSLTFSDSRQDAAMLAGDLEFDHNRDLFRQLVYRLLVSCPNCLGYGTLLPLAAVGLTSSGGSSMPAATTESCSHCGGTGRLPGSSAPVPVDQLREQTLKLFERARINPTLDDIPNYFGQLRPFFNPVRNEALRHINAFLRNEIAATDFGLEPMGLATWRAIFPAGVSAALPSLSFAETDDLIDQVTRLLATEDILLPPTLDHQDWGDLVRIWERNVLVPPAVSGGTHLVTFNPSGRGKLGRFLRQVADVLHKSGRITGNVAVDQWLSSITGPLFQQLEALGIITRDAHNIGYGINIDRFQLERVSDRVHICQACSYVSNRAVLNVCLRCGQQTELVPMGEVRNFYRRTVDFVTPGRPYPDPFSMRVFEHSAQIEKPEARQFELHFQDVFLDGEHPDDTRIDALSVTTTMELGIDIGNLLSVGLRNIPPTVANYQQRAGRAGRRGSGVATVISYAQNRSHDQYYFATPPKIVTDPPRIPRLYLDNRVIAERHVRALVLQRFFHQWPPTAMGTAVGVLTAWGTVRMFTQNNGSHDLDSWVKSNLLAIVDRCKLIVHPSFHGDLPQWISLVPAGVLHVVQGRPASDDVLAALLDRGYLPRHAFPIDVVSFWTERPPVGANYLERGIQRDLGIALSEFAPGAEVVRNKRVFPVIGLYDPFNYNPSYLPQEQFVQCSVCRAVNTLGLTASVPVRCDCGSHHLTAMPFLRPPGFCSEWAGPGAGGQRYLGGGRERAGSVAPAQLVIGNYALTSPTSSRATFSSSLLTLVRIGDLHIVNRGPDLSRPGFRICPQCGRNLSPTDKAHTYPADIPPFLGKNPGPRAGRQCSNVNPSANHVLLGHHFPSEVIQFGVDLPLTMEADTRSASGRAVWLSFGTLVRNAAARVLQINSEELRAGVRSMPVHNGRVVGEVYLYDTLPGGAGYAREIQANLEEILKQALTDSRACPNPACTGACYSCLLDYQNQVDHPLLDRRLGQAILEFLLSGTQPSLSPGEQAQAAAHLTPYVPHGWRSLGPQTVGGQTFPVILEDTGGDKYGILPRHAAEAAPDDNVQQQCFIHGVRCCSHTDFDLVRRPFWVVNHIVAPGP